jgi:hypothetical protein
MKHLEKFKLFEMRNSDLDITPEEVNDIFIGIQDFGLKFEDIFIGNSLSIGDFDVVTDHRQFGEIKDVYRSLSVRLKSTIKNDFVIVEDGFYEEVKYSVAHLENQFSLKLNHIYLRTPNGIWFRNFDIMNKYTNKSKSPEVIYNPKTISVKYASYMDLAFEIKVN